MWFSIFLENPFVSRVKRRFPMRMERFRRSTCEVETIDMSGSPVIRCSTAPVHFAGLYRVSGPLPESPSYVLTSIA